MASPRRGQFLYRAPGVHRILEKKGGAGTKAFALGRVQYATGSAAYSNEHIHSTLDGIIAHARGGKSQPSGRARASPPEPRCAAAPEYF